MYLKCQVKHNDFYGFFCQIQRNLEIFVKLYTIFMKKKPRAQINFYTKLAISPRDIVPIAISSTDTYLKNIFCRQTHRKTFWQQKKYSAGSCWLVFKMYLFLKSIHFMRSYQRAEERNATRSVSSIDAKSILLQSYGKTEHYNS